MKTSKERPLVSVIVTTYNRKELLKETIDSILNQTFRNFELIVVDNFSDYNFFSHIESFNDNRIIPFQNQNNGIIAVNRNFGIKKARGEYIAFCDDDDLWMPEKLKIQTNFLKKTDAIAVGSNLFINKIKHKRIFFKKIRCLYQKDLLYNLSGVALSSLIIRNDQAILFCTKKEHFAIEDYIFQINLTENNKYIIKVRQPLIIYRIHHMNYSSISQIEKAFNMTYDYFDKIPKKLLQNYHYQLAKKYLTNEDFPKVKKHLLLALKQLILNWRTFKIIYKALFIFAK